MYLFVQTLIATVDTVYGLRSVVITTLTINTQLLAYDFETVYQHPEIPTEQNT